MGFKHWVASILRVGHHEVFRVGSSRRLSEAEAKAAARSAYAQQHGEKAAREADVDVQPTEGHFRK